MEFVKEIVDLLSTAGGWGVAALAIYGLYKKDQQLNDMAKERHEEFVACLREAISVMTTVKDTILKCHEGEGDA